MKRCQELQMKQHRAKHSTWDSWRLGGGRPRCDMKLFRGSLPLKLPSASPFAALESCASAFNCQHDKYDAIAVAVRHFPLVAWRL